MFKGILFAFGALLALPAVSQAGPDLKVERARLTGLKGANLGLELGLHGAGRHPVEVWLVRGSQRSRVWQGQSSFRKTAGGFTRSATVRLAGKNIRRAFLEVVIPECKSKAKCRKKIKLVGDGANLRFDGIERIKRIGRKSELTVEVFNAGFAASRPCKVQMRVAGKKAQTWRLSALPPNGRKLFQFRYDTAKKGKRYEAKLVCRDLVRADNLRKGKLR